MNPEKRLILSAILLGIAEQDTRYVTWIKYGNTPEDTARIKEQTRKEALKFVGGDEFDVLCNYANLDADRMRKIDPAKAHRLYKRLIDPRKEFELD